VGGLGPSLIMGSGGFINEGRGAEPGSLGDGSPSAGSRGRAPVWVWGRSPQKLTTYYENNCQKHRLLVGQSKNNKIEGFGGRPPVGGRLGARGPPPRLNPALKCSYCSNGLPCTPLCKCYGGDCSNSVKDNGHAGIYDDDDDDDDGTGVDNHF